MTRNSSSPSRSQSLPLSPGSLFGALLVGVVICILVVMAMAYWFSPAHEIVEKYGRRRGFQVASSVNGTGVLAGMFEASQRPVSVITELSPAADRYDTIVWAPDNYGVPGTPVIQFFDGWLARKPGRTLIYIGRDHDSAPDYWMRMRATVPPADQDEYERRWSRAQARVHAEQAALPQKQRTAWYVLLGNEPRRKLDSLDGPWAEGIDVTQTDLELGARLDLPVPEVKALTDESNRPGPEVQVLLQSENDLLAYRYQPFAWMKSRVIVVANGSFTLNMPLVNREHRKLAARLIAETTARGNVAFLESGPGDPQVKERVEKNERQNVLRLFTIWPLSLIFVHLAALGIAYSVYRFPIFGRAHLLPTPPRADFGQHVTALGELLARTKSRDLARERVMHYHQQARRVSGKSHGSRPASVDSRTLKGENR